MAELENGACGVEGGTTVAAIVETETTEGEQVIAADIAVTAVFTAETEDADD